MVGGNIILAVVLFLHAAEAAIPLVINTWDFRRANLEAWNELVLLGGSPVDAVVAGCSTCERLQCDGTVGYGGSPDENGETTLDAMIMDGRTMNVGAVAGLRNIRDASAVARHVLDNTEHTLLAGDLATAFAERMGFERESLVTPASAGIWSAWEANGCQPNFWCDVEPNPRAQCGPYEALQANDVAQRNNATSSGGGGGWNRRRRRSSRRRQDFGHRHHDTIGMLAIDAEGNVAAGTSTNGARFKIPGRVGDSPIPGAGAYADNAVGAAAATGDGDILMRFLPSLLAVEFMRNGNADAVSPAAAARMALARIPPHYPDFVGAVIAANRRGEYGAACHGMDTFPFAVSNASSGPILKVVKCGE